MESDMVEEYFENKTFIDSTEALELIQSFFKLEFSEFILKEKFDDVIYFRITYVFKEVEIIIGSGRGYIEHSFIIDGKEFPLRQFDKRIDKIEATSKKNILFVLDVIKRFLKN